MTLESFYFQPRVRPIQQLLHVKQSRLDLSRCEWESVPSSRSRQGRRIRSQRMAEFQTSTAIG